jgi:adenylate cyclase
MVPVGSFPFSMGRSAENDLVLANTSISRQHAVLEQRGRELLLRDSESRNHVFLNGQQVEKKIVRIGDALRLGSVDMLLCRMPNIRVRASGGKLEPLYVPQQDARNPLQTCMLSDGETTAVEEGTEPKDWRQLVRSSLKSGVTDVFEKALDMIETSTPFDRLYLLLFESADAEELQLVECRFGTNFDPRQSARSGTELAISREILRRVIDSREAALVTEEDPDFQLRESFVRSGTRSALCLPLVIKNKVGGVLYLDRLNEADGFSAADVEAIGPLAGILALKIENVQLLADGGPDEN